MDSNASDYNAKRHKRLYTRNVDGQFRFKIRNNCSKIEGLGETHYSDESAIIGDDEQELDEGNPDSDNNHEECLMIRTYKFSNYP